MIRVVIADDHDVVRRGIKDLLEADGQPVVGQAADGLQAVRKAIELRPDVVIADYAMPGLNGIEVTRQIKARLPDTEVVVFTMHESDELVAQVFSAGALAFVLKSEPAEQLVAAVRSAAQHRPFIGGEWPRRLLDAFMHQHKESDILSRRERIVLQLIAEGRTSAEISDILNVGIKTIETHRASVMRKLKAKNISSLVRYAIKNRIIEP